MHNHLSNEYIRALEVINEYSYDYDNVWRVIEELIEDYLLRENGRLGNIIDGKYIEP